MRSSTPPRRPNPTNLYYHGEGDAYESAEEQDDHTKDGDLIPETPQKRKGPADLPKETPRKRRKTGTSLGTARKDLIDEAVMHLTGLTSAEYRRVCLVSMAHAGMTVIEYSHIVHAETPSDELTKLEWSWGMEYCRFNVDTTLNIQTVDALLHRWFDQTDGSKPMGWFWVPAHDPTLDKMWKFWCAADANRRRDPTEFYTRDQKRKKAFTYTLAAFPGMRASMPINRYEDYPRDFTGSGLIPYDYPFEDFPSTELHVPYHFVIASTGKKLVAHYGRTAKIPAKDFPSKIFRLILSQVRELYVAWISGAPPKEFLQRMAVETPQDSAGGDRPLDPSGDHGADSNGDRGNDEGGHQEDPGPSTRRRTPAENDDVSVSSSSASSSSSSSAASSSLAPSDSFSNRLGPVLGGVWGRVKLVGWPFAEIEVDDEDEEWEDEEFFKGVKQWAEDVWAATHATGAEDGLSEANTLVDCGQVVDGDELSKHADADGMAGHVETSILPKLAGTDGEGVSPRIDIPGPATKLSSLCVDLQFPSVHRPATTDAL